MKINSHWYFPKWRCRQRAWWWANRCRFCY